MKIIVIAPHPDDETLGCGGTILRHTKEGEEVHWLIMSTLKSKTKLDKKNMKIREKQIRNVAKAYNFSSYHQTNFETAKLDTYPKIDLINEVSKYFKKIKPNLLYIPFPGDIHSDHREVYNATVACTKSFRYPYISKIRCYEVISETKFNFTGNNQKSYLTSFQPNLFIDISPYINKKIKIMKIYKNEIGKHPFPRSEKNIRAIATFRGATVAKKYAESFVSLKEII
jgi:LmbE family N-acetylglucosaminyl deacetylase